MGDKRPSTRTLPTGEKVTHYPEGKMVLQPTNSLAGLLKDQEQEQEEASDQLRANLLAAAEAKREAYVSGDEVAPDKRVV